MSKSDLRGNKIIWFLVGNPTNFASSRIHGFNVHKELLRKSYNSIIAYDSINTEEEIPIDRKQFREFRSFITKGDVVVLQKIKKESNIEFITFLKTEGIRIIFIDCDMPLAISIARLADITICPSELLVQKYSERGIVSKYIEDSPESYFEKTYIEDKAELTCYWFGDGRPNKWKDVIRLKEIIERNPSLRGWKIKTISNHPEADIKWTIDFFKHLTNADAIAIPVFDNTEEGSVKSANRLLQSMAYSIPVLCSPIDSYESVIVDGHNALICKKEQDWIDGFLALKDATRRQSLATAGYRTATSYSIEKGIENWIKALELKDTHKVYKEINSALLEKKIRRFFQINLLKRNFHYRIRNDKSLRLIIYTFLFHPKAFIKRLIKKLS